MRLQMCSNPNVDEGGQHPITGDRYEGSNPNDFFSLCVYLYSYTRIWVRVGTEKLNNSSHSSSVNPSWSVKFKNTDNRPQFTFEKTSEWRSFNFYRLEPGRSLNFCLSSSSLEDTFNVLACARYREKSTPSKNRESPITVRRFDINWIKLLMTRSLWLLRTGHRGHRGLAYHCVFLYAGDWMARGARAPPRRWRLIYFHPLEIAVYLTLFVIVFLIKFLKRYFLSGSIASNYKSCVSIDPC